MRYLSALPRHARPLAVECGEQDGWVVFRRPTGSLLVAYSGWSLGHASHGDGEALWCLIECRTPEDRPFPDDTAPLLSLADSRRVSEALADPAL